MMKSVELDVRAAEPSLGPIVKANANHGPSNHERSLSHSLSELVR